MSKLGNDIEKKSVGRFGERVREPHRGCSSAALDCEGFHNQKALAARRGAHYKGEDKSNIFTGLVTYKKRIHAL